MRKKNCMCRMRVLNRWPTGLVTSATPLQQKRYPLWLHCWTTEKWGRDWGKREAERESVAHTEVEPSFQLWLMRHWAALCVGEWRLAMIVSDALCGRQGTEVTGMVLVAVNEGNKRGGGWLVEADDRRHGATERSLKNPRDKGQIFHSQRTR